MTSFWTKPFRLVLTLSRSWFFVLNFPGRVFHGRRIFGLDPLVVMKRGLGEIYDVLFCYLYMAISIFAIESIEPKNFLLTFLRILCGWRGLGDILSTWLAAEGASWLEAQKEYYDEKGQRTETGNDKNEKWKIGDHQKLEHGINYIGLLSYIELLMLHIICFESLKPRIFDF